MNTINKTHLIAAAAVALGVAGFATVVLPNVGEAIAAGTAIVAALAGMGAIETKKRAY